MGEALRHQIAEFGSDVGRIETSRIFLIDTEAYFTALHEAMQKAH